MITYYKSINTIQENEITRLQAMNILIQYEGYVYTKFGIIKYGTYIKTVCGSILDKIISNLLSKRILLQLTGTEVYIPFISIDHLEDWCETMLKKVN